MNNYVNRLRTNLSADVDELMMRGVPRGEKTTPRRRLESAAARELILDATERRLVVAGPSGIRLQEVAADAGVSHPTVLHHFGSRELLVQAVISRSLQSISAAIVEAIAASQGDETQAEAIVESVAATFERTGHARVVLWLALEGYSIDVDGNSSIGLKDVVDATHAMRLARAKKGPRPTRDDTARTVVLAALALVAGAVVGPTMLRNAGLGGDGRSGVQFRKWLARLLIAHFDG
jgi:AcrR family transcriptional regulator